MTLTGLPYVGGKSGKAPSGVGPWVASLLPQDVALYVEPFCGMLGVLLQRAPAAAEIANDINRVVINWWRVIADPDLSAHLADWLEVSPLASEQHYEDAKCFLAGWEDQGIADIDAAYWWTIQLCLGVFGGGGTTFALRKSSARNGFPAWRKLEALGRRIRHVQLTIRDALDVIRFVAAERDCLVYADPPYPSSPNYYDKLRRTSAVDPAALADGLKSCSGFVALSGQDGDPWDDLLPAFWRTERKAVLRGMGWVDRAGPVQRVTSEVVWTNYDPARFRRQPALFG